MADELRTILHEIENWSIEAKEEDSDRYFYHFNDVELIEKGLKNFVIGRKGTGKTAIAEYINGKENPSVFSKMLTFKNFPFNILYGLADNDYTPPNQYITIWEYVIYNCICSMMATNHAVMRAAPSGLSKVFSVDIEKALSKSLKEMTAPGFAVNILGVGGEFTPGQVGEDSITWKEKVDAISGFVAKYIDNSTYYIIFDALDEDYKDVLEPDRRERYFQLLVGLFKAVQNVRFATRDLRAKIVPLIFLRDDIFDLCRDPDKNKWMDRSVTLDWDVSSLASLIAFRISRARDRDSEPLPFEEALRLIFTTSRIRLQRGHHRSEDVFKFMLRSTFYRPRDIISFVRECAGIARMRGPTKITKEMVKDADELHSQYMRREIIDEMYSIVDDISEVLDLFSEMRKSIFSIDEFVSLYDDYYNSSGTKKKIDAIDMVKLLYHFNVIGNITTGNHQVFAYNTHKKSVNLRENICIHRGLLKCLHII